MARSRPPHLRSWRDGWLHLKLLFTYAPHWLFYYPGMALLGLGLVLFTLLLGGPVTVGAVTFDIAALILASTLILAGYQMACFYALARLFAVRFRLLPSSPRFERISAWISVDRACQFGGLLLAAGLISAVAALSFWGMAGWGDLDPSVIVRPATFAVVSASLGVQTITTGFLWGLLSQRISEDAARRALKPLAA